MPFVPPFDLRLARPEDAALLLDLQKRCFLSESALYGNIPIAPLTQSLDSMQQDMLHHTILCLWHEGQLIGSVRGRTEGQTCHVGRLMVHPDHQGQGLGKTLLLDIEKQFPEVLRFELFTGEKSASNIRLYQKLGYREFQRQDTGKGFSMVYMEKTRTNP
ncbi:GNAT family N-acetyltransferase [Deinococcus misasensis]|uniref:GNAT family N-acetyltransferase n=1 Tax=Deinococcus misasensis TaxID=392413 RepID=UPI00068CC756|nr:GNAT family N-acetyltransferase [Deinococcus misasensis]